LAEFRATLEINLVSAFIALKAAVPLLQANGSGSIVLFSSTAAQTGLQSHESISAAKAGIEGLVRAAAATYAPRNIRVNAIAPGLVETPLSAGLLSSEPARQASEKMHPLGRIGKPEDIAAAAALLLSDEASWITGQTWPVDGGLADLRVRR
jgi:NAD(P)-dependent dehydrogenase (short-subunit alcohol dehydrogenase family)